MACIDITNQCNLNCRTCYNRSGLNTTRQEMSYQQLRCCLDTLLPLGVKKISLSGGEPSLHSDFARILDLVDEYPELLFVILTNGTVHDQKLVNFIRGRKNLTVQVSLDGSDEQRNAATRGSGNFHKALEFLKQIRGSFPQTHTKMVISQLNYEDIEPFYRLAVSVGAMPEYAFVTRQGNGLTNWDSMRVSARQKINALHLIETLNEEMGMQAALPLCLIQCPLAADGLEWMSILVKVDGTVQPCQMLGDPLFTLVIFLDFDEGSFLERLDGIVSLARARTQQDYGCTKCLLRSYCQKGCMANAFQLHGNTYLDDGECEFRKLDVLGCMKRIYHLV